MSPIDEGWVPEACILPTAQRPLRVAEFDELFATALCSQRRLSPTELCWELAAGTEALVRDLVARESACCSFFSFDVSVTHDAVAVEVRVPVGQEEILDGLADRGRGRGVER